MVRGGGKFVFLGKLVCRVGWEQILSEVIKW